MRTGAPGAEKPAARIDGEHYVDLSDVVTDFDGAFFAGGGIDRIRGVVEARAAAGQVAELGDQRGGAPIARPPQILASRVNSRNHPEGTAQRVPDEPILFTKPPNTLIG